MLVSNTFWNYGKTSKNFMTENLNSQRQAYIRHEQKSEPPYQNAMFVRTMRAVAGEEGLAEEVDRRAYKVKLQLTSKKSLAPSLHIIKGKRSSQTISTTDIWQALAVRRPCRQSVTDGAVVSPPWCVLLWIWVALGWAPGSLNVFILFFFIVLLCRALTL